MHYLISMLGTLGFGFGAVSAYLSARRRIEWGSAGVVLGGVIALLVNGAYFGRAIHDLGVVETFHYSFESTLLLATLLGLAGLLTHLSSALRGLDSLLFAGAAIVEFWALLMVRHPAETTIQYQPWFVTHSLAFLLSAACFIAAGVAGVAYLVISRLLRKKRPGAIVGVAPLESLERFGRWMLMIGFPLYTYGILTGICELVRAEDPGPGAWLRDPLVMLSFFTWVVYAVLIASMWLRPEIRGRRAAALATCGMGLIAVVFLVIEFVSPVHR